MIGVVVLRLLVYLGRLQQPTPNLEVSGIGDTVSNQVGLIERLGLALLARIGACVFGFLRKLDWVTKQMLYQALIKGREPRCAF